MECGWGDGLDATDGEYELAVKAGVGGVKTSDTPASIVSCCC